MSAGCGDAPAQQVEDAWVRSAPPSAAVLAGYFTLRNRADRAVTIVDAHSDAFGRIEIHETFTRDGTTGMRRIEGLEVAAGDSVVLAPGGRHLMLMHPDRPLAPGDRLEIVLELDDGTDVAFPAEVRRAAP